MEAPNPCHRAEGGERTMVRAPLYVNSEISRPRTPVPGESPKPVRTAPSGPDEDATDVVETVVTEILYIEDAEGEW